MSKPLDLPNERAAIPADCTAHCEACRHKKLHFQFGKVCGLTDEKPTFEKMCASFEFHPEVNALLGQVNAQLNDSYHRAWNMWSILIQHSIIAVALILTGYVTFLWLAAISLLSLFPLFLVVMGILSLVRGVSGSVYQKQARKKLLQQKADFEAVVAAYSHKAP